VHSLGNLGGLKMTLINWLVNNRITESMQVAIIVGVALMFGYTGTATAQSDPEAKIGESVEINSFVPNEVPVAIASSYVLRTKDGKTILKFGVKNATTERYSNLQFLVLVVDHKGNVKAGQGWRDEIGIGSESTTEIEQELIYPVADGNKLVLAAYEAVGNITAHRVAPVRLLTILGSKGLIKERPTFIKTVATKLANDADCAAVQTAASAACACGIKTFSCNPQTGAYSFSCFSHAENPTACPDGPPEN
jgi:hypothetical protein